MFQFAMMKGEIYMKRFTFSMVTVLVLSLTAFSAAWAAETTEEETLDRESAEISKTAGKAQGATVVSARLEKEFNVTEAQIQGLRDKKLGYGEIAIVFSLAQKLPGGISDANISQVMALRQGPPTMGWGEIAKKLDLKLGPSVSQVKNVNKETHREMGREAKAGKGGEEAMEHQDRSSSMERHGEIGGHEGMSGGGSSHGKAGR